LLTLFAASARRMEFTCVTFAAHARRPEALESLLDPRAQAQLGLRMRENERMKELARGRYEGDSGGGGRAGRH